MNRRVSVPWAPVLGALAWHLVTSPLAVGCATGATRVTSHVDRPEPFRPLEWTESTLLEDLPTAECVFGGTTRRSCRRGCRIGVLVRDELGVREEEHRIAGVRRVIVVRRSDGSVSGHATLPRADARLDVFFESSRGAEHDVSHALVRMRDPRRLGVQDWLRRYLVEVDDVGTHMLAETGDHRVVSRTEGWVAPDGRERWTEQHWRDGPDEARTVTTRDAEGRVRIARMRARHRDDREARRTQPNRPAPDLATFSPPLGHWFSDEALRADMFAEHETASTPRGHADAHVDTVDSDAGESDRAAEERVEIVRDARGRIVEVDSRWKTLTATRDEAGRVVREVARSHALRTLERVYDERGRLLASRVRTVVRDEHYESDARYAYEGTCNDVEPPIVLGHEAETDSPFAFTED